MKQKNNLLRTASILIIVCAVIAIVISAVNTNQMLNSMTTGMSEAEISAVEAQLNEQGVTMDQAVTALSGISYVGLGFVIAFNAMKIIVGILGLRKADSGTKYFFVWGIVLLIFGVFSLLGGIFTPIGICNLLGGIAAPIMFIVGSNQNKNAPA